jgi:protein-S-isoprenylcysteine O-methyltransferase Ste14
MSPLPDLGSRGQGWVVIQVLLLLLLLNVGLSARGDWPEPARSIATFAGVALMVAGGALIAWGARGLGRGLTAVPRPRAGSTLVRHGAFALVRHPLYGGLIVMAVGWSLALMSLATLLVAVLLGVFFDLKSRREEAWLAERFPDYPAYAASTKRLIPWIY